MIFRFCPCVVSGAFIGSLVLFSAGALAQDASAQDASSSSTDSPLAPDRPGFTNGSSTVAPGRVILESGFAQTRDRAANGGDTTDDFPETLLRFGTTPNLELQLGLPNYNVVHGGARGFGDAFVGAKLKVYERGGTVASIAPSLSVPFGRRDFRSSHILPSVLFGVDTTLGKRAGFSANLTLSETEQSGGAGGGSGGSSGDQSQSVTRDEFAVAPSASASYSLTPKLGVYLDAYAIVTRRGGSTSVVDGGFTYLLNNDLQLDVEYGHGLGGAASPNRFYGGGVAVRF